MIRATDNHPWYVVGRGWVSTVDLRIGHRLRTADGSLAVVTDKFDNGDVEPVFNLCVANAHTYFVGNEHCAVLVHNTSPFTALISTALFGQVSVRPAPTLRPMPRPGGFQGPRGNPSNPGPRNDRGFSNPGPNPGSKEPVEIPQWQRGDLDYLPSDGGANDTVNARIREANQRERDKFNDQRTQAAVESARAQGVPENVIQATIKQQHLIAPGQTPPDNIAALNKITAQYWAEANPEKAAILEDYIAELAKQNSGNPALGGIGNGGYGIGGSIATGAGDPNKRGPKTDPDAAHNAKIREVAQQLEAEGNTIVAMGKIAGGEGERVIRTEGGVKQSRRPDILYRTPSGELRGANIGRTNADGSPVAREQEALRDLGRVSRAASLTTLHLIQPQKLSNVWGPPHG